MAYVKLAPLAVFLLATLLLIFPMKKVEAASCGGSCSTSTYGGCGGSNCRCNLVSKTSGFCSIVPVMKIVEEHPNLCQSHVDCMKKGSGNFCAHYTNPDIQYGWCFVFNSEAEAYFNIASNSEAKGLFKIPVT